jgi:hypothetical protein
MTTAQTSNPTNTAIDAPRSDLRLSSIASAGVVYSLGLNWLMSERSRRQQRAVLADLALQRPAVSALTFAAVYLTAASLLMLTTAALSMLVISLAGSWSSQLAMAFGITGVATRMLLVLRSLWQS